MNERPTFSILHTSARPGEWRKVYDAWLNAAARPEDVEYVLVVDPRWGFPPAPYFAGGANFEGMRPQDKVVVNSGRMCYVDGVNLAAKHATGKILIVNADDQFPCDDWDEEILETASTCAGLRAGRGPAPPEYVIRVSTGTPQERERRIIVAPIVSRARYERLGYIFYPEYESMFADNDLCEQAEQDGVIIDAPHLMFPHKHPFFDASASMDAAYERQNRREAYERGAAILQRRRAEGFGSKLSIVHRKKTIAICLPGEWFPSQWVGSWTRLLAHCFMKFENVAPVMMQSTSVFMVRQLGVDGMARLEERPDYVLWIDDDNLLAPEQLDLLIADLDRNPDIGAVVGWCYILDGDPTNWNQLAGRISCGYMVEGGGVRSITYREMKSGPDDLKSIEWSGMPVFLHRYELLEKIGRYPFCTTLNERYTGGMQGEDVSFCERILAAGYKICVDRRVKVPHLKLVNPEPVEEEIIPDKQEGAA